MTIDNDSNDGVYFTENIDDYGSEKCLVPSSIFPDCLPSSAENIRFSYYNYWNQAIDIYVEVKFDSLELMQSYLVETIAICEENYAANTEYQSNQFIETQNPHNADYIELFCSLFYTIQNEKTYTGYKIKTISGKNYLSCNFGIISYSFDELTVIHTYVCGEYQENIHNYVPCYFRKFNIPLNEDLDRTLFLKTD